MTPTIPSEKQVEEVALLPCPFCGVDLHLAGGVNPYGRCETEGCWMHDRKLSVPLDDPRQVVLWNTRAALEATQVSELRRALEACRDQFLEYERHHRAKVEGVEFGADGRRETLTKAKRNADMAAMCDAALKISGGQS